MNEHPTPASPLRCAQCGRAPLDSSELARWRAPELVVDDPPEALAAGMLLCPDCVEDDRSGAYDLGEAD